MKSDRKKTTTVIIQKGEKNNKLNHYVLIRHSKQFILYICMVDLKKAVEWIGQNAN